MRHFTSTSIARPFLKWAGGKRQLISQIDSLLPPGIRTGEIRKYVEPFIGGSAVFFHVAQNYPISAFYISDQNAELILAYQTIQQSVSQVIEHLYGFQRYFSLLSPDKQKLFYYQVREKFNQSRGRLIPGQPASGAALRTAQLIFLNRTCFNGLFRVNKKGEFNVPFGRYKYPTICDAENLQVAAAVLQQADIHYGDFEECRQVVDAHTFVYFDPPYRPLSKSASFTAYARHPFNDAAQIRLANFYRELDGRGALLMLSNSDPQNENPSDDFFSALYQGFHIHRVQANRAINSNGARRGKINELLITNYG